MTVLEFRPVIYDDDRGWMEYGNWRDETWPDIYGPDKTVKVIRRGEDWGDNWIITTGGGHHYRAVVAETCYACDRQLEPESTYGYGGCDQHGRVH